MTRADRLGYGARWLLAATSHVDRVAIQHRRAGARHPIEPSWLGAGLHRRTLAEYEQADLILVASAYSRDSFLAAGVAPERLRSVAFHAHPRFRPRPDPATDRFVVTYTGRLTVDKGVPLLVDAVASLPQADLELVLVGGCSTPAMGRWLDGAVARDPRIRVAPGDPLPHLRRARLHVHPSWEDGFGYGPMEAVACGVPVVVTEDTGMKERLVLDGGAEIVPTGDLDALEVGDRRRLSCGMRALRLAAIGLALFLAGTVTGAAGVLVLDDGQEAEPNRPTDRGQAGPADDPRDVDEALPAPDRADIAFAERDEATLLLDVYLPAPDAANGAAVVLVHGGRWHEGDRRSLAGVAVRLSREEGYVAVTIDTNITAVPSWPTQVDDVTDGLAWARRNAADLGIDPGRIALLGSSSGGHLAVSAALRAAPGEAPAAAVSWSGPMDLVGLERDFPAPDPEYDPAGGAVPGSPSEAIGALIGCYPSDCPELAAEASPITQATAAAPPIFLLNGSREEIPAGQAESMAGALAAAGAPHELLVLDRDAHGPRLGAGGDGWRATKDFLERQLGVGS